MKNSINKDGIYLLALLPERDQYYLSKCLAQGFCDAGIPFNANFSDLSFDLTRDENITMESAAVCVFDISSIDYDTIKQQETQDKLNSVPCKRKVYISMSDSNSDFYIADNEAVLFATSESAFIKRPGIRLPWAFGLSNETVNEAESRKNIAHDNNRIVYNFRPSVSQHIRQSLDLVLIPQLEKHFEIDRNKDNNSGRFKNEYYDQLASAFACLTYGGTYTNDITKNVYLKNNPFFMKPEGSAVFPDKFEYTEETVIVRWDSWRFWESMALGSLNICINLEKYGCMLPEMPNNWEHYIGLDLDNLQHDIERILDEKDNLPEIAKAGKIWALEHYSPKATALRFVEAISRHPTNNNPQ